MVCINCKSRQLFKIVEIGKQPLSGFLLKKNII